MPKTYEVLQEDNDIGLVLDRCDKSRMTGQSLYRGMTYEEGVEAGIRWLLEEGTDHPFDEEDMA